MTLVPDRGSAGHHQRNLGVDGERDHDDAHHHVRYGEGHCETEMRLRGGLIGHIQAVFFVVRLLPIHSYFNNKIGKSML